MRRAAKPSSTTRHSAPVAWRGVAVALLAVLAFAPVSPAAGVDSYRIVSPGANTTLADTFTIIVEVDASDGELIDGVDVQLAGPTNRVFQAQSQGPPDVNGVQRWSLDVDPIGDQPMRNGRHRLVARPVPRVGDSPPFQGHEVVLAVPVDGELVAAPTGEDPTVVALSWDPVDLPDFVAYRIERRPDAEGGRWTNVAEFDDPAARDHADTVPEPGRYRYRLVIVRSDGSGEDGEDGEAGEVRGYSEARGVRADPADPGTFQPPREPDPNPTAAPTEQDGSPNAGGPVGRPGDVAQGGPGGAETGTATTPPPPAPPVTVRPPASGPAPAAPAVVPFNDGVFEELLPLGETETEFSVLESEAAFIDGSVREGGTLAVLTEEPRDREVVVALATGLLLLVAAGHVRRYLGAAGRR